MSKPSTPNIDAYPLQWPVGYPRTKSRERGSFAGTPDRVRRELVAEIDKLVLGARARSFTIRKSIVISSNVRVRQDGEPYASYGEPDDPGVAVYFERNKNQVCFACDKYDRVWKNMRAIQKTLEAMRGIERWGSSDLLDRAFTGFLALPEAVVTPWREALRFGLNEMVTLDKVLQRYRELAKEHHPDAGGDAEAFAIITKARDMALAEIR